MNLNNILAKAQQMILSEDFNRQVERAASAQKGQGGDDFSAVEDELFGMGGGSTPNGYNKVAIPESAKYSPVDYSNVQLIQPVPEKKNPNTKIPSIIRESFEKNPSPVEAFEVPTVASQINLAQMQAAAAPQRQQIREQAAPQQAGGGIDYNALKFIINECIQNALKEKLNEGVVRGMKIGDGNVIQFLDSRGNLYEGQLKLKKKAKK